MKHLNNIRSIRFVNVGEDPPSPSPIWIGRRQWPACLKYGFLSAGQGKRYSDRFNALITGDVVAAYVTGRGYVGVGQILNDAIPIKDFIFEGFTLRDINIDQDVITGNTKSIKFLEELPLLRESIFENAYNQKAEVAVQVEWLEYTDKANSYWIKNYGLFASRLTHCTLEHQTKTIDFLEDSFRLKFKR